MIFETKDNTYICMYFCKLKFTLIKCTFFVRRHIERYDVNARDIAGWRPNLMLATLMLTWGQACLYDEISISDRETKYLMPWTSREWIGATCKTLSLRYNFPIIPQYCLTRPRLSWQILDINHAAHRLLNKCKYSEGLIVSSKLQISCGSKSVSQNALKHNAT